MLLAKRTDSALSAAEIHEKLSENMLRLHYGDPVNEDPIKYTNPEIQLSGLPLPPELYINILDFLDFKDILAFSSASKGARKIFELVVAKRLRSYNKYLVFADRLPNLLVYLFMLKNELFDQPYPDNFDSQGGFSLLKSVPSDLNIHLQALYLGTRLRSMETFQLVDELNNILKIVFAQNSISLDRIFLVRAVILDKDSVFECLFNAYILNALTFGVTVTLRDFNEHLFESMEPSRAERLLRTIHINYFNQAEDKSFKNLMAYYEHALGVPDGQSFCLELSKIVREFNNLGPFQKSILDVLINYKTADEDLLPFTRSLFWFAFYRFCDCIFTAFSSKDLIYPWSFSYSLCVDFLEAHPQYENEIYSIVGVKNMKELTEVFWLETPIDNFTYGQILANVAHYGHLPALRFVDKFFHFNHSDYEEALIKASKSEYAETVRFLAERLQPSKALECLKKSIKNAVVIDRVQNLTALVEFLKSFGLTRQFPQEFADRLLISACSSQFVNVTQILVYDSGLQFTPQAYLQCLNHASMDLKLTLFRFLINIKDIYTFPQKELDAILIKRARDDQFSLSYGAFRNLCKMKYLFSQAAISRAFSEAARRKQNEIIHEILSYDDRF